MTAFGQIPSAHFGAIAPGAQLGECVLGALVEVTAAEAMRRLPRAAPARLSFGVYDLELQVEAVGLQSLLTVTVRYALPRGRIAATLRRPVNAVYARWRAARELDAAVAAVSRA